MSTHENSQSLPQEAGADVADRVMLHGPAQQRSVPTVEQLRGAMWTQDPQELLVDVGIVRSVQTVGDGACPMHAIFGTPSATGRLYCPHARVLMRHALHAAYLRWRQDGTLEHYFGHVLELIWVELAKFAAVEEWNDAPPEPMLFWKHVPEGLRIALREHVAQERQHQHAQQQYLQELDTLCREEFTVAVDGHFRQMACTLGLLPPLPSPSDLPLELLSDAALYQELSDGLGWLQAKHAELDANTKYV